MIISCKCGKYEFEINKNDIPKEGRNVQCGVCNETWFQTMFEKKPFQKSNTNHHFANLFLLCIIVISLIGVMETFKNDLLIYYPQLAKYYQLVEVLFDKGLNNIKTLFSTFSIRY